MCTVGLLEEHAALTKGYMPMLLITFVFVGNYPFLLQNGVKQGGGGGGGGGNGTSIANGNLL